MTARGRLLPFRRRTPSTEQEGTRGPESQWFWDHYEWAAGELASFCEAAGIQLADRTVADIGCGDGILSLGTFHRVQPRKLVGFDVVPTDLTTLRRRSQAEGVVQELPDELEFRGSEPVQLPAVDGEFDFVYSWSAFEHIADPLALLREIRRILHAEGHFFLQLWPFYRSQKGSHLWPWLETDFHHLLDPEEEVVAQVRSSQRHPEGFTEYMLKEFRALNRITVAELQEMVQAAGFVVRRLELITNPIHLEPELARYSWNDLAIGGVKLIATPEP